jgi:hypothetical protein
VAGARGLENEIRVGLEQTVGDAPVSAEVAKVDPLDAVTFGKTARRHVREFGSLFAIICGVVAGWKLSRGCDFGPCMAWLTAGALFGALGWFAPRILMPVWRGWMKFAHCLSIVMTAVILIVTWCVGFLPMALALRVFGIKRMDTSFKSDKPTYWEPRDQKYDDFKRLELQY